VKRESRRKKQRAEQKKGMENDIIFTWKTLSL
jgi:hypothetical protein